MSPLRTLVVGVAAAVVVALTSVAPASAHDDLLSSTPAANERWDPAPASVSLEFSAEVMELGALVMVADAAGTDWAAGEPTVQASSVSVPVAPDMPAGGYEVRWRVVSSDGHPVSGVIPFTVGDAEPLQRTPGAAAGAGDGTAEAVTPPPADAQDTQENGGVLRVALVGAAGAAVAVALLAGIHFLRRRKMSGGTDDPAEDAASSAVHERHIL